MIKVLIFLHKRHLLWLVSKFDCICKGFWEIIQAIDAYRPVSHYCLSAFEESNVNKINSLQSCLIFWLCEHLWGLYLKMGEWQAITSEQWMICSIQQKIITLSDGSSSSQVKQTLFSQRIIKACSNTLINIDLIFWVLCPKAIIACTD